MWRDSWGSQSLEEVCQVRYIWLAVYLGVADEQGALQSSVLALEDLELPQLGFQLGHSPIHTGVTCVSLGRIMVL